MERQRWLRHMHKQSKRICAFNYMYIKAHRMHSDKSMLTTAGNGAVMLRTRADGKRTFVRSRCVT